MDTLDQKDSLQSQNIEEQASETVTKEAKKEKKATEKKEKKVKADSDQSSKKVAKKKTETKKKSDSADLKAIPDEQVEDKKKSKKSSAVKEKTIKEDKKTPAGKKKTTSKLSEEAPVAEISEEQAEDKKKSKKTSSKKKETVSQLPEEAPVSETSEEVKEKKKTKKQEEVPVEEPVTEATENIPAPEKTSEVSVEITPNAVEESEEPATPTEDYSQYSEEELVAKAKELMEDVTDSYAELKERLDGIKHTFYKKFKYRQENLKKEFLEAGGLEEDFSAPEDELENEIKAVLNTYREKRNAELQALEKEKQDNLNAKNRILEELKGLLESTEDFGKKVPIFQKLQQEWKTIGQVPPAEVANLWKNYQLYVETFYDNLKINNELRDYDFRKNLEAKSLLCDQTEKLAEEADVVAAFRKLQIFHEEWREIGPVSRENRESIWERFKAASTVINKKHHDYFDKLREGESENLVLKTAICEKVEAITTDNLSSYKEWQDKTDEIVALQDEWKKIGFAPKKDNVAIYERFRAACDSFFQKKNEYYKAAKEVLVENLAKKIALCEKAEELKDSQSWKETADKMVQLQKEWKTIGSVPKKQSDAVWKRFISACDYFFDQKEKDFKSQKGEQENNLKRKRELIGQINALETAGKDQTESLKTLKALIVEYNEIGHVPFKEKDKLYKEYKTAIDAQFDRLNMDQASRRMDFFRANLEDMAGKGQQKLQSERKRLMRVYESLNSEIATFENNIGFFSGSSKNAAGMIKDMERKIAKLKEERELVVEKIKMLEDTAK